MFDLYDFIARIFWTMMVVGGAGALIQLIWWG